MSEKLTYHLEGDYLIPDLIPPESPHIGIWGERRRRFLRTHQKPVYDAMLMNGTLTAHLEEVDQSAEEMMDRLTTQLAAHEGITESLKAADQMAWVQKMNSARKRSEAKRQAAAQLPLKFLLIFSYRILYHIAYQNVNHRLA